MLEEIRAKIGTSEVFTKEGQLQGFRATSLVAIDIETYGQNGLPGDSFCFAGHGVLGVSVCNSHGEACYVVVNDQKDYGGIPIRDVISWLNNVILYRAEVVVTHHGKFDMGFLFRRGLSLPKIKELRWMDTWLLANIRNEGAFISTRLKDLMKSVFDIEVRSETLKDKFFEEHKTQDYGDLPIELLAPYACDDVRYTLMLLLGQPPLSVQDMASHDLYIRNWIHLICAERRGVALDVTKMRGRVAKCLAEIEKHEKDLKEFLGATDLDIKNTQALLQYLHQQNLHPAPRPVFGETAFVFDKAFLISTGVPVAVAAAHYIAFRMYLNEFSAKHGRIGTRAWVSPETEEGGLHPGFHMSVYARGGIVEMKDPNVTYNGVPLESSVRAVFIARKKKRFIVACALQLKETLLAYYCQDKDLLAQMRTRPFHEVLADRAGITYPESREVCRGLIEGSGKGLLELRLKTAGIKVPPRGHFAIHDKIEAALPGLKNVKEQIEIQHLAGKKLYDVRQRAIKIDKDKLYRQYSILIGTSYGSVLSTYMDAYCQVGLHVGARLVIAHECEFVFEVDEAESERAYEALLEVSKTPLLACALPSWYIAEDTCWRSPFNGEAV